MRFARATAVLLVGVLALGACGGSSGSAAPTTIRSKKNRATTSSPPVSDTGAPVTDTAPPASDTTPPVSDTSPPVSDTSPPATSGPNPGAVDADKASYQQILDLAPKDIQAFWRSQFPKVFGKSYTDLSGGIFAVTPDNASTAPGCGSPRLSYRDVQGNAFYCSQGDFIAYDNADLFPKLFKQFGAFMLALVLAHELGHQVQNRAGIDGPTIMLEQQADCFAGAWSQSLAQNQSKQLKLSAADLDIALGGYLQFRDEPGTVVRDPQAHGSAFDRVRAYQDGFQGGAAKCKTYVDNLPPLVEIPFGDQTDQANNGNLPFDQIQPLIVTFLDRYYAALFKQRNLSYKTVSKVIPYTGASDAPTSCGTRKLSSTFLKNNIFYCAADDYIAFDNANLMPNVYTNIGDFAVGLLLANAWADAAQTRLGVKLTGQARSLQADCLTGSWTGEILKGTLNDPPNTTNGQALSLSPGDLDEAVSAFLAFGSKTSGDNTSGDIGTGSAFDRIASFKNGFFSGVGACNLT